MAGGRPKGVILSEQHRARIKTSQIVNMLNAFVLGKKFGSCVPDLSPARVTAALGLLKKTIPDLQNIEATHKGDAAHPIPFTITDSKL